MSTVLTIPSFGINSGILTSFGINSGILTPKNLVKTNISAGVHLTVSSDDRFLLMAHYSGAVSVSKLNPDGRVGPVVDSRIFTGKGSLGIPDRQDKSHAHFVILSPDNRFVFITDLGTDKIMIFRFLNDTGTLGEASTFDLKIGSGPRHLAFDPSGKFLFLVNELSNTLDMLLYDSENGSLKSLRSVSTLIGITSTAQTAAALHFAENGQIVYVSNRGNENSIVGFELSAPDTLKRVESINVESIPRDFALYSNFVVSGSQKNNTVNVYSRGSSNRIDYIEIGNPIVILKL
jgi:6-phosphogluconolactonase